MRGEVYRLLARSRDHERRGRRFAVVLQPDRLDLSTWIVAFTSLNVEELQRIDGAIALVLDL